VLSVSAGTVRRVIVDTLTGKVQGLERRGAHQFRGIPYARADRFRPPSPAEPWAGVRQATAFGPIAPQNPSATESFLGARRRPSSEDCLFLNVFTPGPGDPVRPVMVWIHGGGFTAGSSDVVWYDGSTLARTGDVVVVTINYRLGALGFLHLDHLDRAFAGSGVNGLRDQIAALSWVRDNIAGFGGDPGNVTVFGESAGGMSVGALLGSPAGAGLFHRAIAQSGAAAHVHAPATAERVTDAVVGALGAPAEALDALLAASVADLLRAQAAVDDPLNPAVRSDGGVAVGVLTFQPVVGGDVLPQPPLAAVRAGSAAGVPLVAGTTADEWNLFHLPARIAGALDADGLRRKVGRFAPADRVDDLIDAYRRARPSADPDGLLCAAMTDMVFRHPATQLAEAHVAHTPDVAMYRFDRPSTAMGGVLGACHAIDVPFVFDNLDRGGVDVLLGGLDDDTLRLGARTSAAWAAMAHTGAPVTDDLRWPAYDLDRRATCVLDRTTHVDDDPEPELRVLWEELRPAGS
jgi:para-nitrobenzyl esterase